MSEFSAYSSLIFWLFVPSMITDFLLGRYYGIRYGSSPSRPKKNSSKYNDDRSRIYVMVVIGYLAYSLYSTFTNLPPNYYSFLSISPSADSKEMRSTYRRLTLAYHPDKNPGDLQAQQMFMKVRKIYETISDPLKRSVYDKLGADTVMDCQRCSLLSDYISYYLTNVFSGFYVISLGFLLLFQFVEVAQFGQYWRYVTFFTMGVCELWMIIRDDPLAWLFPNLTTSERISLLHQNYAIIFIALSQIGPILFPVKSVKTDRLISQMEAYTKLMKQMVGKELRRAFEPFQTEEGLRGELMKRIEKMVIEEGLLSDKEYGSAVVAAKRNLLKKK